MTTVTGAITNRHKSVIYYQGGDLTAYTLFSVFTENTEKPSAQSVEKKYTVNKSSVQTIGSYKWEMAFTADLIKSNTVVKDIYDIGREMKTGMDAVRKICMIDLDEKNGDGAYYAREMDVSVAVSEFADNSGELQLKVFFADPCSPWQRGCNENANGLLRFFFPRGTNFNEVSDEELQRIVALINNRPRKRLGALSPIEYLEKLLLHLA